MLLVNCKNYTGMSDDAIKGFVDGAGQVARSSGAQIAVAPPQHMLKWLARSDVAILAQHVDSAGAGSTTGYMVPELLKRSGVAGAIINHSEHRIPFDDISDIVPEMRKLEMVSVLCTRTVAETLEYAGLEPDYVAIEPPELIGTGRSISTHQPTLISDACGGLAEMGTRTKLLCGAGIVNGQDVRAARGLGAVGVLVASGVVKAAEPASVLEELAGACVGPDA